MSLPHIRSSVYRAHIERASLVSIFMFFGHRKDRGSISAGALSFFGIYLTRHAPLDPPIRVGQEFITVMGAQHQNSPLRFRDLQSSLILNMMGILPCASKLAMRWFWSSGDEGINTSM